MLMHFNKQHAGLSLVELMVGIVVGMIVVGAVGTVYVTTVRGSASTLRTTKLNQEMRAVMDIMVNDIRRAGGWGAAIPGSLNNPFTVRNTATPANDTDLTVLSGGSCILYTYDATYQAGNTVGTPDNAAAPGTDYFGFKLTGDALQMRHGGDTTSNCGDGNWETVTDDNTIAINALTFYTTGSQCRNTYTNTTWEITSATATTPACDDATATGYVAPTSGDVLIETRQIAITLQGSHKADPASIVTLTETVKVRNNRILVAP